MAKIRARKTFRPQDSPHTPLFLEMAPFLARGELWWNDRGNLTSWIEATYSHESQQNSPLTPLV